MVSFTCDACGQTIRKNKVEKHYQQECRGCSVLSCLDCGKDFAGDTYAQHTSCITEAEKYQGALYQTPKGGKVPKGQQKQDEWLEVRTPVRAGGTGTAGAAMAVPVSYQKIFLESFENAKTVEKT